MATSLAVRNVRKLLDIPNPDAVPKEDELPDGHMRLYNNWRPSLAAGLYSIEATQVVQGQGQGPVTIKNAPAPGQPDAQQRFNVVAPQFSLDPGLINSYYPPDGHQDEPRILPHIVFSDPHVPWLRKAGKKDWMLHPVDNERSFVPWMALMVFKADDLRVTADEAAHLKLDTIKAGKGAAPTGSTSAEPVEKLAYDPQNQPSTGAFGMTVGDYINTISSRVRFEEDPEFDDLKKSNETTSIIFPLRTQVQSVFNPTNDDSLKGLQAQKLLSHVRQLNTIGFPDAGVSGHGFYSIVMSGMTGDMSTTLPTTHIVHLVSIEHLDGTLSSTADVGRIGMVSLFSWVYHCIPESVNFEEMMKNLGTQAQPLRPPREQMDALKKKTEGTAGTARSASKLLARLNAGFTIARWRAPSGEESVAFNRGPLAPVAVAGVPSGDGNTVKPAWPALSMNGRDYMIFDKQTGMVDATYASAWSLGKLLAVSDPPFNSALLRFRSAIWNASTSELRKAKNNVQDWTDVLTNSVNGIQDGLGLSTGGFSGPVDRINKPASVPVAQPVDHPSMAGELSSMIQSTVKKSASSPDSSLYNGFLLQSAANSDWEIIYNWIYGCMFLAHIPAHVLFPEPSHLKSSIAHPVPTGQTKLQDEALRFFHVDHAWIDCFIDGALSCANHVEPEYDNIRLEVKRILNDVLSQKIGKLDHLPPVPQYGFVLRSAAVKATPDIKLIVRCWKSTPANDGSGKLSWSADEGRDPLLRHTKLDDYTILSLIECPPEEIAYIEFAQPAHQQRFAFGADVTANPDTGSVTIESDVDTIKLFTNPKKAPPFDEAGNVTNPIDWEWKALPLPAQPSVPEPGTQLTKGEQSAFYNKTSRVVDVIGVCNAMTQKVIEWGTKAGSFDESGGGPGPKGVACSGILGLEFNDRAYHLRIPGTRPGDTPFKRTPRQLWTGAETPSTGQPVADAPKPEKLPNNVVAPVVPSAATTVPTSFPPPIRLHSIDAVPMTASPVKPSASGPAPPGRFPLQAKPYLPSKDPEFELLVHPDYGAPPPRPDIANGDYKFSIADKLPTKTRYLYDLVFSIRRRHFSDLRRTLRFLHIEIPLSRGSRAKDAESLDNAGHFAREPLLVSEAAHSGLQMAANPRFVPALFYGTASRINDGRWDELPVLLISLTPRSGKADGTMALMADGKASAIAVRLAQAQLAEVVFPRQLNVYRRTPQGGVDGRTPVDGRATVPIRLTEVYGDGFPQQWSWCMAVKADEGDDAIDKA